MLVYEHDPRDTEKQRQAAQVIERLAEVERLALSAQCLTEFYSTSLRLPEPLTAAVALAQVGRFARMATVLDITSGVVLEACRGSADHRISIWDSLIWATAKMNGIPHILTEDAEHGRSIEQVTYLNPFDARFDLIALLG